jgi:uncharacterized membrane protein YfcA
MIMRRIAVGRERFTGLAWPHLTLLCLLAGAISGVVAFWWRLDVDWFPLLALAMAAIVISVAVGLAWLAGTMWGSYDDEPKDR